MQAKNGRKQGQGYLTLIVGALTAIFMARGAFVYGLSGALTGLAFCMVLTGLYVVTTGRQSWAQIKGGRKMGAVLTVGGLVMFLNGLSLSVS